mmetsp:Transcript_27426/g.57230  ORF Transcript_27426/g.57230 Transcript_27426/m.57230 type:complete len:262 (+) Transcript_27426:2-787(+)
MNVIEVEYEIKANSRMTTNMICPTPNLTLMICILFAPIQSAAWSPPSSPSSPASSPQHVVISDDASLSRKHFLRRILAVNGALLTASSSTTTSPQSQSQSPLLLSPPLANAAPPFAIMEEEMGYYPMKTLTDETVMVPSKVKRTSTSQSIALAKYLQSTNAQMYGAFWCPHCSRQKELFGKEAWAYIDYVECSPKGYKSQFGLCTTEGVDGYPEWKFGNGKRVGGEMELMEIAKASGWKGAAKFDGSLETGVPSLGGAACQ